MIHNFFGSQLDLKLFQWPKSNFFFKEYVMPEKTHVESSFGPMSLYT